MAIFWFWYKNFLFSAADNWCFESDMTVHVFWRNNKFHYSPWADTFFFRYPQRVKHIIGISVTSEFLISESQSEERRWKNGVICLASMFHSWIMVLKLLKKMHFLLFYADLSKKYKPARAIYIYASESSYYTLSENFMAHRGLIYCSWY